MKKQPKMLMLNWFSSACIVMAVDTGSLHVNTMISMHLAEHSLAILPFVDTSKLVVGSETQNEAIFLSRKLSSLEFLPIK